MAVRGHCVTWGKTAKVLEWVQEEEGVAGVVAAVRARVEGLVQRYGGRSAN